MEQITVANSINMNINKDDVIDILIDKQLTQLENEKANLELEIQAISDERSKIDDRYIKALDKKLLKLLPKELSASDVIGISYYKNYQSTPITFKFEAFKVTLTESLCTEINFSKKDFDEYEKLDEQRAKKKNELVAITEQITKLEKSPKRLKAQLLREFLKNTPEGKQLLELVDNTDKKVKQLGN